MLYRFLYGLIHVYFRLFYGLRIYGQENAKPGAMIVVCNHSSMGDPIYAAASMPDAMRLRFMAKAELFRFAPLRRLIAALGAYPIERGAGDIGALRKSLEMLKNGQKLLIFPDGTRSDMENPDNAKNGAALLACKSGAPVLPVYISPDRSFLYRRLYIVIGESYIPRLPEGMPRAEGYRRITQDMMKRIYALRTVGEKHNERR
ncbi:MAG: 1-acyl-sn-glycerol-3-phosphate acyltransferase [Oscillospiraceae bacterium]|nr:1-acyl-sn-glycerol-3-phosphate acyltransferase [Oscillospiraceae bacterium]